jgi:hypothetical protein
LKSEHHVSSSKRRPRPIDPWYCEPTIFLDNRLIGSSHVRFGSLADNFGSSE